VNFGTDDPKKLRGRAATEKMSMLQRKKRPAVALLREPRHSCITLFTPLSIASSVVCLAFFAFIIVSAVFLEFPDSFC